MVSPQAHWQRVHTFETLARFGPMGPLIQRERKPGAAKRQPRLVAMSSSAAMMAGAVNGAESRARSGSLGAEGSNSTVVAWPVIVDCTHSPSRRWASRMPHAQLRHVDLGPCINEWDASWFSSHVASWE